MRILDFIVSGQTLRCDPECDFTGIAPGSRGYLHARFSFSQEWTGCKKVALFYCRGKEFPAPLVKGVCVIPAEALVGSIVQVSVEGRRGDFRITAGTAAFKQG